MENEEYITGDWLDSTGNVNPVRYKKKWGSHIFTDEENRRLLAGEEISFSYNGRMITGHLQYYFFKGKELFGFKSDYPSDEYEKKPVYHSNPKVSSFRVDLEKEKDIMSEYMRLYHYSRLLNSDRSGVDDYQRIEDVELQKEGVDLTYTKDGKKYVVDEKAQMDYIFKPEPLPTFSLELLNSASGCIGWLINSSLKTEYYMFIWPHAEKKPLSIDGIIYAYYALVNKKKLLIEIEKRYKMNSDRLLEYAKRMARGNMGEEVKNDKGTCIGYRYKEENFDDQGYLYYTLSKPEKPVNLVVRRSWLEKISEAHGTIKR